MSQEYTPAILIADHDRAAREGLRTACVQAGFLVQEAETGREALAHLDRSIPDLIVADVGISDPGGWTVCESVKADPQTREIPFVFLALGASDAGRIRALELGAYDVLSKPVSPAELVLRFELILERVRAGSAAGESRRSYLAGHTSLMSIPDLVQMLSLNTQSGCLRVRTSSAIGRIHFREGRIIEAFSARARGRKALFRILGVTEADFHFDPADDPNITGDLKGSTQSLLMDALVSQDDLTRVLRDLPALDAPLARNVMNGDLPVLDTALAAVARDVLSAMRTARTIRQLFDAVESTDLDVARSLADLLRTDAVVVSGSKAPTVS